MDIGAQLLGYSHTPRTVTVRFPWDNAVTGEVSHTGRVPGLVVELAETREELARGLMNRKDTDQCRMLFNFPDRSDHRMWMRNTFVPLDMIFIDGDRVVGVANDTVPLSEDVVSAGSPSTSVLEVPAGSFAESYKISPGRKVEWFEHKEAEGQKVFYPKLLSWLLSDDPVKVIRDNWKEVAEEIPELGAEKGCKQDPSSHRYDVLGHSLLATSLTPREEVVRVAALFHDIGKPVVKIVDDKGINRFPDHGHAGARVTAQVLKRIGAPDHVQEKVPPLVGEHYISYKPGWADKKVLSVVRKVDPVLLNQLAQADIEAHRKTCPHLETDREQLDGLLDRIQRVTLEHGLHKAAEFAPGIPEKSRFEPLPIIKEPKKFTVALQRHEALRAGSHLDLRVIDPETGFAHSWAMKKLPKPGESTYSPMQPTHEGSYASFSGTIPKGTYGAGEVKVERHEPAEVVKSGPGEMRFNLYSGRVPEQFVLKQQDGGRLWTIHNTTPSRSVQKWQHLIPVDRPHLKEVHVKELDPTRTDTVLQPKMDGAFGWAVLEGGKPVRFFSYRDAKNETGLIEHTHKMPGWWKNTAPQGLRPTVVGGEIYGHRKGKTIPSAELGGILNSRVEESRKSQAEKGVALAFKAYHIDRLDGRRVGAQSYPDTQKALQHLSQQVPVIDPMPTAATVDEKTRLLKEIVSGRHKLTREGFVERSVATGEAIKAKIKSDYDVYIRSVYPGTENAANRGEAGGFRFSWSEHGPESGSVGSGMSRPVRKDMLKNPEKWVGRVVRVESQEKLPSGALRMPVFKDVHPGKSKSISLEM